MFVLLNIKMENCNKEDSQESNLLIPRIISFKFSPNYTGNIEEDKKVFLQRCRTRFPFLYTLDILEKIEKAIDLVYELFKDDRRGDGTMFYTHFLETAHILIHKLGIDDVDTIVAALLHDTLEDKKDKISFDDIKNLFNQNVAEIVEGVTKITSQSEVEKIFSSKVEADFNYQQQELATIKKIFEYGLRNPRIFLVKFADRFHNVLTLYGIRNPERREQIAKETINIYVPLMKLFGFEEPSKELRDLCLFHIIARDINEAEEKYQKLLEIHKQEYQKFISIAIENNLEEKIKSVLQKYSSRINLLVGHKTLYELYEALKNNKNRIPINYQHIHWIVDIPSDEYSSKLLEQIERGLRNKFAFIASEQISNIKDKLTQEIIQYISITKSTFVLPSKERMEILFNVSASGKQRFDINEVIFKKEYHQSYDEREYQAFLELIEYLYNQNVPNKMELLFEFAKKIYPTEYVSVEDNLNETSYLVPNGFTVLDLAFKLEPRKAFNVVSAKILSSDGQWESRSLNYVLRNNDKFELITAAAPIYDFDDLKPFSLVAINEVRKSKDKVAKRNILPKDTFYKRVNIRGIDKLGVSKKISDLGTLLNVSFTKFNFIVNPLNRTEFKGNLAAKFGSINKLNIFLLELIQIPEVTEFEVVDEEED